MSQTRTGPWRRDGNAHFDLLREMGFGEPSPAEIARQQRALDQAEFRDLRGRLSRHEQVSVEDTARYLDLGRQLGLTPGTPSFPVTTVLPDKTNAV